MMRAEAGIDEFIFHRFWIEHGNLARTLVDWEGLGVRVLRALLAPVRVIHAAHSRRQPDTALLVEHRVVIVGARVPQNFATPIRRIRRRGDRAGMTRSK